MTEPIRVSVLSGRWPVPSESPACLKLLTWLQMAEIPHETEALRGRPKSATGKAPYVTLPDGTIIDDSSMIIERLTVTHDVRLDATRSTRERALMLMAQRTVETHLYFAGLLLRWGDNWHKTRDAYFGDTVPAFVRVLLGPLIRRGALAQAKGQGMGRRPRAEVYAEAVADIDALAELLGDEDYFFGSPGVTDAIVYGALENARACPIDGPTKEAIVENPRWMAYLDRIKDRYWSAWSG